MNKILSLLLCTTTIVIFSCSDVSESDAFKRALANNGHTAKDKLSGESAETKTGGNSLVSNGTGEFELVEEETGGAQPETEAGRADQPANAQPASGTTTSRDVTWVRVADMTENSFSVIMPQGWTNAALLHRLQSSPRSLVTAVSPDKSTVIYFGDPRLPTYTFPGSQAEMMYQQMGIKYPYQTSHFVDAETYFSQYLQKHFGSLEGFRVVEKFDNQPMLALQEKRKKQLNMDVRSSNVSYRFEYKSKGRLVHGELNGTTVGVGNLWLPEVGGFCTTGNPKECADMMIRIAESREENPKWQEAQNEQHRQTMASIDRNTQIMTQQHQQRMADIQRSGAAHQQRMADLQQANDMRNEQWKKNQASQDAQHEKFLNVIKGEHTVQDREGNTYQVDNSQEKYFVDKHNNTYIGTDGTKTLDDLRQITHQNLDNFEEVQIIR